MVFATGGCVLTGFSVPFILLLLNIPYYNFIEFVKNLKPRVGGMKFTV